MAGNSPKQLEKKSNVEAFDSTKSVKNIPADSLQQPDNSTGENLFKNEVPPPSPKLRNLSLKTTKACRKSIARLMRLRLRGEIEPDLFKQLLYGMQVMSSFIKVDIEEDLIEIKEVASELKNANKGS